ncbi:MAG: hypothetical protein QOF65_2235, partial [Thermoleophilaceae bacterium]|nr:hypothetical protein [Thermoleophilaceae bacterium]
VPAEHSEALVDGDEQAEHDEPDQRPEHVPSGAMEQDVVHPHKGTRSGVRG